MSQSTKTLQLTDGHIVVSGIYKDRPIEFHADVESLDIDHEAEYHDVSNWDAVCIKTFPVWEQVHAIAKLKIKDDGRWGKIKYMDVERVRVGRTARIEAEDRTVAALEAARVRAGVPEKAKYRLSDGPQYFHEGELTIRPWDEPRPVSVEFYWEDEV